MNPKKDPPPFRTLTVGDPGDPRGFTHAITNYLEQLAIRGLRPSTLQGRSKALEYFALWAQTRGLSRPADITRPILERYQKNLFYYRKKNGQPLSFATQRHRLTALRGFFGFLARQNLILYNPASDLDLPRLRQRLPPPVFTASEVEQILTLPDIHDPFGCRDRALLETLYSTGMRRGELVYLKIADLDASRGAVAIRCGKGGKDRIVPIGERALAWIDRYLAESRPQLAIPPDPGFLFLTYLGQCFDPDHLSYLVARYIDRADLGKKGSCHLFRHTVATLMLEGGADCRYVQEMLGHAQLSTTQIYLQVTITTLKAIHAATHPAAYLKPKQMEGEGEEGRVVTAVQEVPPAVTAGNEAGPAPPALGPCRSMGPRSTGSRRALLAALAQEEDDEAVSEVHSGDTL